MYQTIILSSDDRSLMLYGIIRWQWVKWLSYLCTLWDDIIQNLWQILWDITAVRIFRMFRIQSVLCHSLWWLAAVALLFSYKASKNEKWNFIMLILILHFIVLCAFNIPCNEILSVTERKWINSLRTSDAYMRQKTRPSLIQIMGCCLFNAKPLSKSMMTCCQLDHEEHISMKYDLKFISFHSRKCIWSYHLWNGSHFVSASMC